MSGEAGTAARARPARSARLFAWIAVRLWFLVVPAFVVAAVWAGLHTHAFESGGTVINLVPSDAPALSAERDSQRLFGTPAGSDVIVVQHDPAGLSPGAQRRVIERAAAVERGNDPSGASLAIPLIDLPKVPASRGDMTTAVTHLMFGERFVPAERVAGARTYLRSLGRPSDGPVGITGVTPARIEEGNLILGRLRLIELLTLVAVAAIVVAVFRSPGAAVITLATIGVTFPITLWALTEIGDRTGSSLPQEVEPLVIALLLGVVTDYSVFFLSEFRERMHERDDARSNAFAAAAEVMPIVFTGGLILSASLLALRASSLGFFRDLGPALAATVAVAMVVSSLFVPALISLLGRFAVWPSARPARRGRPGERGRLAHVAAGRPLAAVIGMVCIAGLVASGLQLRAAALGVDVISGLPSTSESQIAARAAREGFAPGVLAPLEVIVRGRSGPLPQSSLVRLEQALRDQRGFSGVAGPAEQPGSTSARPFVTKDGTAARYVLVSSSDPLGPVAERNLTHLQDAMPELVRSSGLGDSRVDYSGQTALAQSAVDAVSHDAVTIASAVLLVNLLLMALFMRALVAPLALLAVNVLSVSSTLGATVWVFQRVLGYPDITYYVPFAGAVLLVSLSSDYNVLVAGRIWREAERMPMREAIATAAPRASRAIRAAGLSLAASFALVALVPVRSFRELAAVMVIGILLETFLVRSLLAPALLALLGTLAAWPGRPGWTSSVAREA